MFFIKVMPLLVYSWIFKSKSKGLGNYHSYTISFLSFLFIIHLIQLGIILNYFFQFPPGNPGFPRNEFVQFIVLFGGYFLIYYLLSKIYNRKRFGRWYAAYKEKRIITFRTLIVWCYMFINLALIFILILSFRY